MYKLALGVITAAALATSAQAAKVFAGDENNTLVTFNSNAPGVFTSSTAITGTSATFLALDFRDSNGLLYGLGEKQRTSLMAGVQYNYLPFSKHDIGGLNNLSVGVGVRFTLKKNTNSNRYDDNDDNWNRGRRMPRRYGW